jgi:hypothetical protein
MDHKGKRHILLCGNTKAKMTKMRFLRLNVNDAYINDAYNAGMGHMDVSNELWNYYWMNHWLQMQKWQWAIYLWVLGICLVNAYVCYRSYHLELGTDKKNILSQYEFCRSIALAWISPHKHWPTQNQISKGPTPENTKRAYKRKRMALGTKFTSASLRALSGSLCG